MDHLTTLESESIAILRESYALFKKPLALYSVGKDSSVLLHLIMKSFAPSKPRIPLLHIDTGFKFPEMIEFRDRRAKELGFKLIVHRNEQAINNATNPYRDGIASCCGQLKTAALLEALGAQGCDAAIGGARRDEEISRAKERFFSFRDTFGQWEPRGQRPELWRIFNAQIKEGESMRIFPLSNWTEADIWEYIKREGIEVVPLYFGEKRLVFRNNDQLMPAMEKSAEQGSVYEEVVRYRTLGCYHCTAAVKSEAKTLDEIIAETSIARISERSTRVIDHGANSMEDKKREGYF